MILFVVDCNVGRFSKLSCYAYTNLRNYIKMANINVHSFYSVKDINTTYIHCLNNCKYRVYANFILEV